MIIKNEKPPIWDNACAAFKINPANTLFTFGDTIYNPGGIDPIPAHLLVHEEVHAEQQGHNDEGAALWWGKFLRDHSFRLEQEARAYGAQYTFLCKTVKDRNQRYKILWDLAGILSGPLYANCSSRQGAVKLIQGFAGVK
jgi:hypothetical protein